MYEDLAVRNELVAVAILVLGVVLARLMSMAAGAVLGFLDRRTARFSSTDRSVISPNLVRVTRVSVFWLFVILAISHALRVLGIGDISAILGSVIAFLPQLLVGFVIVVAGHIAGLLVSHLVAKLGRHTTIDSGGPLLLYWSIVSVSVVMGLQHVGVDITFVTRLILLIAAVVGGGLMAAFAFGARQHVANLLARRELSRFQVGERIRIDGIEGEIVATHSTGLDLSTEEGVVSVPAARFAETNVLRRTEAE